MTGREPEQTGAGLAHLPYRRGVGMVMFNRSGLVFAGQRHYGLADAWQMPQGGIEAGETPEEAAYRELGEETGVPVERLRLLDRMAGELFYDLPSGMSPDLWGGRYRGQRQIWFAFDFLGHDGDIAIDGPESEFSAWRWCPLDEMSALAVPFKREVYDRVARSFAIHAGGRNGRRA